MGGLTGWLLLLCLVSSAKASFSPTINKFVFEVCEDVPIGSQAFTIEASDPDGDTLTYALVGPNAAFFQVDPNSGVVTVKSPLDRENSVTMLLDVTVSDTANLTPGRLTIILNDANDNSPIFRNTAFDISVPENTTVGGSVFTFLAEDEDEGDAGVVRYSITEIIPAQGSEVFEIGAINGELKLKGQLNYNLLSSFYRLRVNAGDLGGSCGSGDKVFQSSNVFAFVTVVDMPDLDPIFISAPYIGSIEENSAVDTSVLGVTAIDQDKGINDNIIYTIEDSTADGLFKISENDGIISISSAIDREVIGDTVTLTVKATESEVNVNGQPATTTTTVQVNIGDVNDNPPQFYNCEESCVTATQFTGEVFEHSLGAISIGMTVKDPDKSVQTELRLEGVDKDVFSVEPSLAASDSIVQLLVRQPANLDFEKKQQMVLQVIAIDKDKTTFQSTATVTINIKDTNDNSPTFLQDTYKLKVAEHSPVGTEVLSVTAEDPDTMDAGKITYSLLPESILEYFDVDTGTGRVYVKNNITLDRELRSLYSATLQARDSDGKPGTTVLEITLTDINDQPPIINRDLYREFVKEDGQLEFKIEVNTKRTVTLL
ncbi:hypothetical protein ATANTOWER_015274 [Ataeniobius toweri]|uniref:Cadherin domain-containing protein n=1 Tax=Ataeniobius toweri TaxID=208326 RepID=A0ABU7AQN2_9TELE|nr:hypothetical protein [Ataeniobius toweri]